MIPAFINLKVEELKLAMAIDWEDILGAEGAGLSDAWEDAVWEGQKLADRYFDEYLNQKEDIESRYHESPPEEEDPHGWEDFSDHTSPCLEIEYIRYPTK